ncbi:MAG TPA: hypothetical protein VGM39_21960 [Kofleriaceae bacterium]|jgi:hypothetical protein
MSDPDMEYVTRRELREELAPIHTMLRHLLELAERNVKELERHARESERIARELREDVPRWIKASAEETRVEFRRDLTAALGVHAEETRTWIATLDDKYKDLPARVTALEQQRPTHAARRRTTKRS